MLEPSGDGATVCLKSNSGKYLIVDKFGNVTCDSEEKERTTTPSSKCQSWLINPEDW